MTEPKKRRLVTEKQGFRVRPIKHERYQYTVYRIEQGRRVEQAYFNSERQANTHAHLENIRLKNEGLEGQILSPELRGQAIESTRRLAPYGKSLRDAVDFYELHLKSHASLRQIKLEPFIQEFLQAKEEGKTGKKRRKAKPRYLGTLRPRLALLREHLPEYNLEAIESEHLTDFLESRPMSGRTWNNYRRDFHVAFAWAVEQKYLLTNPAASVPEAQEDPINAQVLTPEEFGRLIKSAEEALWPVLALQGFAGLRRSEVEQIEWDDIKFDTGKIVPTKTKSGKWRYINMRPNLRAWLEQVPSEQRSGRVCRVWYRKALDRARLEAEVLAWPHNCLRHSFSSYSLVAEENEPRLQMELGHSTPRLLIEHYRAMVTPAHAKAWWSIGPEGAIVIRQL
jgi:integrase